MIQKFRETMGRDVRIVHVGTRNRCLKCGVYDCAMEFNEFLWHVSNCGERVIEYV